MGISIASATNVFGTDIPITSSSTPTPIDPDYVVLLPEGFASDLSFLNLFFDLTVQDPGGILFPDSVVTVSPAGANAITSPFSVGSGIATNGLSVLLSFSSSNVIGDEAVLTLTVTNADVGITVDPTGIFDSDTITFQFADVEGIEIHATCFAPGTEISIPDGTCPVERLRIGDRVLTADGQSVAVKWIGRQVLHKLRIDPERYAPVRVLQNALGPGSPDRDLVVTSDHALIIDGIAINAGALVNGDSIVKVPESELEYRSVFYHVETEKHEVILANGAPAESFVDNVSRRVFDNFAEFEALYGDVPEIEELPYPRAMSARQVPARIKAMLANRTAA